MYTAHLHFEIRKNLFIGYNQSSFGKDYSNYYAPSSFIAQRRKLSGGGRSALVAVNTFNLQEKEAPPPTESTRAQAKGADSPPSAPLPDATKKRDSFRVNRFSDMFSK
jgi:hypothetical protein